MRRWLWRLRWPVAPVVLWFLAAWLAPFPHHKLRDAPQNTQYLDREGRPLRRTLGVGGMDADWVRLEDAGDWAGPALVSVEDQRFYAHPGVDPVAVARAVGQNVRHMEVVSGASTLSTQVIKLIEPRPRTWRTKLIEAFRATQLELHYDKEFILEQYLNRAPFGGNRQGVQTASRRYFGKEAAHLSSGEAALLAGLPQRPEAYRPDRNPEAAERRRETVLRRMRDEGVLTEEPLLSVGTRWVPPTLEAFAFTEWVRRRTPGRIGDVRTTLDANLQRICERAVWEIRNDPAYAEIDGTGVVLMEAETGAVRAWVGTLNPEDPDTGMVDTVTRRRAPGSTLKPFAYALGMQRGWLTPDTVLEDRPRGYRDYRPENMDARWSGGVTAREALIRSLNLPALNVVERTGVEPFLGVLRRSGISLEGIRAEEVGLGSVLGGGMETSLLELVEGYSLFARGGVPVSAVGLEGPVREGEPVVNPGVAYWVGRMLSGPERDAALYGAGGDVARPALAFKTGTSHGLRDAWAVGWNGKWVLGVWIGRMDGRRVPGLSGTSHAAPLLGRIAVEVFGTDDGAWPAASDDIRHWNGREIVVGVTDPEPEEAEKKMNRILHPPPDYHLEVMDDGGAWIPLRASGEAHWFLDGVWLGVSKDGEDLPHRFPVGRFDLRAVFADGGAETRRVTVGVLTADRR